MKSSTAPTWFLAILLAIAAAHSGLAHDETREAAARRRREIDRAARAQADPTASGLPAEQRTQLILKLLDGATGGPLPCLVRMTTVDDGLALQPPGEIHRAQNWFSLAAETTLDLPRRRLRFEAIHGLETEQAVQDVDLSDGRATTVELRLRRIFDAKAANLWSGNTHLHLRSLDFFQMDRYLRLVPRTDGLDVVFVSHLERIPDDKDYTSNLLTAADLGRLSDDTLQFGNGEEHRHNFGTGGEGYGHVMFLNIQRLIEPASIGPGIMKSGTDGQPLHRGIQEAHRQDATVIWCHNRFGLEDVPNWLAGVLDAQNIHDGGSHGSYNESYYRYLNVGLKIPFSTGTDWFIYDFSRVYVPRNPRQKLSPAAWLKQLESGQSTITNGPLLEFTLDTSGHPIQKIGDELRLHGPRRARVYGKGIGRHDFHALEVIRNGDIIGSATTRRINSHFVTEIVAEIELTASCWLALRIPDHDQTKNELGQTLFAHTSPIYVQVGERKTFVPSAADQLLEDMRRALADIPRQALFANDAEQNQVLDVYRRGIRMLEARLAAESRPGTSRKGTDPSAPPCR